ncbi:LPXTG cell wall anchor domain-containing protein [Microbacterium arthrosphaerae]
MTALPFTGVDAWPALAVALVVLLLGALVLVVRRRRALR